MRTIIVWSSVEDKHGNFVRGHFARTNSIIVALKEVSEKVLNVVNVFSESDFLRAISFYGHNDIVCIVDNRWKEYGKYLPERSLVITDEDTISFRTFPRVINAINPKSNIYTWESPPDHVVYKGIEHAIINPIVDKYTWHGKSESIALIPGGNYHEFFENYLGSLFEKEHIHILQDETHEELLEEACRSKFVICTPSVVSLEMIAMGVPFAFIQTADDQTAYVSKYLEFGGIDATDIEQLKRFVRNPQPMPKIADSKHTYKLAQHVYQMMMEK